MSTPAFIWLWIGIITVSCLFAYLAFEIYDLRQMEKERLEILRKRGIRK